MSSRIAKSGRLQSAWGFLKCSTPVWVAGLLGVSLTVDAGEPTLDVYWIDVEGGAATLIVTPDHESVLVDSGSAGQRDASRIIQAAKEAGLKKLDHFLLTHFHSDHFGGIAEVGQKLPVGSVYDNGIPARDPDGNPNGEGFFKAIQPYRVLACDSRKVIQPGDGISLRQTTGAAPISLKCLGTRQTFLTKLGGAPNALCDQSSLKAVDTSDNANSVVMLLELGDFRLFAAGDLTWNMESRLACPVNLVGGVDVYQVTHHGLQVSNNPLLMRSLAPTVSIMSNGTGKGCEPDTFATLAALPSLKGQYQIHRNLRADSQNNTVPEHIANLEKNCSGNYIKLSVSPDGLSYTVSIPAKGTKETYLTQSRKSGAK